MKYKSDTKLFYTKNKFEEYLNEKYSKMKLLDVIKELVFYFGYNDIEANNKKITSHFDKNKIGYYIRNYLKEFFNIEYETWVNSK